VSSPQVGEPSVIFLRHGSDYLSKPLEQQSENNLALSQGKTQALVSVFLCLFSVKWRGRFYRTDYQKLSAAHVELQQIAQYLPLTLGRLAGAVFPCMNQGRCNTHFCRQVTGCEIFLLASNLNPIASRLNAH
jgi:hypothetical protein